MSEPSTKRVALYARQSNVGNAKKDISLPDQLEELRAFCAEQSGWVIVEEFVEAGSGVRRDQNARRKPSPKFDRTIAEAKAGRFDLILTVDSSRFGRDGVEDLKTKKEVRDAGCAVDAIHDESGDMWGEFDDEAERDEGRATFEDQYDLKRRRRKMMTGHTRAIKDKNTLAVPIATCFGFETTWSAPEPGKRPKRVPVEHSKHGKLVRDMFRRFVKGESFKSLAAWLSEMTGTKFYDTRVKKLLGNEVLTGALVYGRTQSKKFDKKKRQVIVIPNEEQKPEQRLPVIVSRDLFDKAQERLAKYYGKTDPDPAHTLRGLGYCATCGAHTVRAKYTYKDSVRFNYACGSRHVMKADESPEGCRGVIREQVVDEAVIHFVRSFVMFGEADIRRAVDRYNESTDEPESDEVALLQVRLAELKANLKDAVAEYKKRPSSAAFADIVDDIEKDYAKTQAALDAAVAAVTPKAKVDSDVIVDAVANAREKLGATFAPVTKTNLNAARKLLPVITESVTLDFTHREITDPQFAWVASMFDNLDSDQHPVKVRIRFSLSKSVEPIAKTLKQKAS